MNFIKDPNKKGMLVSGSEGTRTFAVYFDDIYRISGKGVLDVLVYVSGLAKKVKNRPKIMVKRDREAVEVCKE